MEVALGVVVGLAAAAVAGVVAVERRRRGRVPPRGRPLEPLQADATELERLLQVIETEILPKTAQQVALGNKVFGAAVLRSDLSTVLADTNHETTCPLYHGEVYVIEQWSKLKDKPVPAESVFLATHEPCCLCISAIVWTGFKKCYYLYPYETTADQGIPHDLKIMHELWAVERYQPRNQFCATAGLIPLVAKLPDNADRARLMGTVERITAVYDSLANKYHDEKAANPSNTMAFN